MREYTVVNVNRITAQAQSCDPDIHRWLMSQAEQMSHELDRLAPNHRIALITGADTVSTDQCFAIQPQHMPNRTA